MANVALTHHLTHEFAENTGRPTTVDTATRDRVMAHCKRQLAIGSIGDNQSLSAVNDNQQRVLTSDDKAYYGGFYTMQMAIAPLNEGWAKYYDPFSRVGLRIRMGLRAITRMTRAAAGPVFGR